MRTLEGWGTLSKGGLYTCETRYFLMVVQDEVEVEVETTTNKLTLQGLPETTGTIMPDEDTFRFGEEVETFMLNSYWLYGLELPKW